MWTSLQSFLTLVLNRFIKGKQKNKFIPPECVGKQCLDSTKLSATKWLAWFGMVYPKMRLADRNMISALWRRYQQSGNTRDRRRSGRPRVTSLRQNTYIRVTHLRNQLQTAALTARGTLVQEPWETACMNGTFALGVQQSVQSYSDVTVLLALHAAGPIFALLDKIGRVSWTQTSHVSTWIAVMVVPGYTVELENGTRITVLLNVVSLAGAV